MKDEIFRVSIWREKEIKEDKSRRRKLNGCDKAFVVILIFRTIEKENYSHAPFFARGFYDFLVKLLWF